VFQLDEFKLAKAQGQMENSELSMENKKMFLHGLSRENLHN
jgi:hypothetical protein